MLSRAWPTRKLPRSLSRRGTSNSLRYNSTTAAAKQHDPLRILFCGADEFSIYSLSALHELQQKRADKILSIDVVCRPDKRVGRGLKQIQEVPIKRVATDVGLRLHQIDTFKGWSPPAPVDLVVTVSFGLLVPARIIDGAKYGGVNIHPSLLPEFRGPAPIQRTLLQRRTHSGVTLQTMHPTKFDHGMILDQTRVNISLDSRPQDLVEKLGPLGAEMLAELIHNATFVPPLQDLGKGMRGVKPSHAPKITPEDRHIDWDTWSAEEIILRDRVLGRLWDATTYRACMPNSSVDKRVTFHGPWVKDLGLREVFSDSSTESNAGLPVLLREGRSKSIGIRTVDAQVVVPTEITIEGEPKLGGRQKLTARLHNTVPEVDAVR